MLKFVVRTCHLVAILSESVIYEEEGYKAIPIKEARETMHASLVYVKGMYQRNAVKILQAYADRESIV
ncbi:MAG: hypothetical protein IKO20_05950 [Bacteroidaceae bacterium]|nr:hypothetical protein [Bacteroidaceae bacterium]